MDLSCMVAGYAVITKEIEAVRAVVPLTVGTRECRSTALS
jgi:hypothetical protein